MDMETTTNLSFSPVEVTLTGVNEFAADFLNAKLTKVNKRLAKLGAPAASLTFGPLVEKTEKDEFGFTRVWREFETVTVTGVEAKFAGWTGVATFDWTLDPNEALVSKFPGEEETPFPNDLRFTGRTCGHCGKVRSRNLTILFRHDDGTWLMVGTSCVVDFIGVDPKNVLWLSARAFGFDEDDEEGTVFGRGRFEVPPAEFLAAAAEATRLFGFVKSRPDTAWDEPTKSVARTMVGFNGRWTDADKKRFAEVDWDRGRAEAERIMAWVADDDGFSDFMTSAKLACRTWRVTDRTEGLLAALPFSYMRAMGKLAEREAAKAARPTDFLGTVGEKLTVEGVVTFKMAFEPYAWGGPTPYRLTIVTDTGHTVTTKGSGNTLWKAEVGDRVRWTGKVTELEDHAKFGKRTECRLVKVEVLVPFTPATSDDALEGSPA
jgi:hypothetical protein